MLSTDGLVYAIGMLRLWIFHLRNLHRIHVHMHLSRCKSYILVSISGISYGIVSLCSCSSSSQSTTICTNRQPIQSHQPPIP
jgi:hypothetical protein